MKLDAEDENNVLASKDLVCAVFKAIEHAIAFYTSSQCMFA